MGQHKIISESGQSGWACQWGCLCRQELSTLVSGPQFQDCMRTPALFGPLVDSVLFLSMTVGGLAESSGSKTFALYSWQLRRDQAA